MSVGNMKELSPQAVSFERRMLENKIANMNDLPTLPVYVMKVMELMRDQNVNVHDLVNAIEHDQSLVTQILRLINSGYYGLRNTVDTVERAVTLLGILGLKQVVLSAAIIDFFSEDEQIEWAHSYSSSVLMSRIMKDYEIPVASNLPMTMLMHDIGKVVLRRFNPQKCVLARDTARKMAITITEAEEQIIHITHAEVGGIIMEKWQMTDDIIIPIKYHHNEKELPDEFQLETMMVQIVNYIDCAARHITSHAPKPGLMKHAGIMGLDFDFWINHQREVIAQLDQALVTNKKK